MLASSQYKKKRGLTRTLVGTFYPKLNMYWSWYEPRNFGDWIGPYLFEAITGTAPNFITNKKKVGSRCFYTVGSILRHIRYKDYAVVWGSGIISKEDKFYKPLSTHAVRGPYSRQAYIAHGYECPNIFGDPGILLSEVYNPNAVKSAHVGIIPHYFDYKHFSNSPIGIKIIDVTMPVEAVVNDIVSCDLTFSSSLHGIIVSHSYGIPCVWISPIEQLRGDGIKFKDYFAAIDRDPAPQKLPNEPSISALRKLEVHAIAPNVAKMKADLMLSCPFVEVSHR